MQDLVHQPMVGVGVLLKIYCSSLSGVRVKGLGVRATGFPRSANWTRG